MTESQKLEDDVETTLKMIKYDKTTLDDAENLKITRPLCYSIESCLVTNGIGRSWMMSNPQYIKGSIILKRIINKQGLFSHCSFIYRS